MSEAMTSDGDLTDYPKLRQRRHGAARGSPGRGSESPRAESPTSAFLGSNLHFAILHFAILVILCVLTTLVYHEGRSATSAAPGGRQRKGETAPYARTFQPPRAPGRDARRDFGGRESTNVAGVGRATASSVEAGKGTNGRAPPSQSQPDLEIGEDDGTKMVLPNVLLIGAQKSGTTSVAQWLFESGGVCGPRLFDGEPAHYGKEVHFFGKKERYERGIGFYADRFRHCGEGDDDRKRFVMDATPKYLLYPERVRETYGRAPGDALSELKLMVILREPVSRELSLYNHVKRLFLATNDTRSWFGDVAVANGTLMSFDQYAENKLMPNIFKEKWRGCPGRYVDHLRRWVDFFGRRRLLVLSHDELLRNPNKFQWRVEKFLGGKFPGEMPRINTNEGGSALDTMSNITRSALALGFAAKNEELYVFLDANKGPWMEERPFRRFESL